MNKICLNCSYFYQINEYAGDCQLDSVFLGGSAYTEIDASCNYFNPRLTGPVSGDVKKGTEVE